LESEEEALQVSIERLMNMEHESPSAVQELQVIITIVYFSSDLSYSSGWLTWPVLFYTSSSSATSL